MEQDPNVTTPDGALETPTPPEGADESAEDLQTIEVESTETAPTPHLPSVDEIAGKVTQDLRIWLGRRDRELVDTIKREWGPSQRPSETEPPTSQDMAARLLENPKAFVTDVLRGLGSEEMQYNQEVATSAAQLMAQNDMFDKDKTLAADVIEEIKHIYPELPKNIHPKVAARLVLGEAMSKTMMKRMGTKPNPLAHNKPATGPLGTIQSSAPARPGAKPVVLDDKMRRLVQGFGFSEDVAQELLRSKG